MGKTIPRGYAKIRNGTAINQLQFTNVAALIAAGYPAAGNQGMRAQLTAGGTGGVFCEVVSDGTNWRQVAVGVNAI